MTPGTIRTVLVDDHVVVRKGFAALLRTESDIEIIAEACDGEQALAQIDQLRPHVAVVDIAMPRLTGIELARKLRDQGSPTAIVLLSQYHEPSFVRAGLEAGASAYVVKEARPHELVDAIRAAAQGEVYLSPLVAKHVVGWLRSNEPGEPVTLTPRERDVLRLLARGLSSKEIASKLEIGTRTVESHRASIMSRLNIRHVPGLVKYALKHGLATLDE